MCSDSDSDGDRKTFARNKPTTSCTLLHLRQSTCGRVHSVLVGEVSLKHIHVLLKMGFESKDVSCISHKASYCAVEWHRV